MLPSSTGTVTRSIVKARIDWLRIPLRVPYELSFASVREFAVFQSQFAFDDGSVGYGESTPLPGYTAETPEQVWSHTSQLADRLIGSDLTEVRAELKANDVPAFAATLATMPFEWHNIIAGGPVRYPLLGTVMAHDVSAVEADVRRLIASGYSTLKVKVGWDIDQDISYVRAVEQAIEATLSAGVAPESLRYRIDANQGYDVPGARRFIESLNPSHIELFEQPFQADNWEAMQSLDRVGVPLMLDESIDDDETIDRAASLGNVAYVKFKLMKAGGVSALRHAIAHAKKRGLGVVVGNGVAAEINCVAEAVIARDLGLTTAGEMNGFLKPVASLASGVTCEGGYLIADATYVVPDVEVRDRYTIATIDR